VDNSPDPEIEDVKAHLIGGVPRREVEGYRGAFRRYRLDEFVLLTDKNDEYLNFKDTISEKDKIRGIIEDHRSIQEVNEEMDEFLGDWWQEVQKAISQLPGQNNLAELRKDSIIKLKKKLISVGILDEFQIAGIFVNWWESVKYDLKTIVSTGWSTTLIPDDYIKKDYFQEDVENIEKLEAESADLESQLNELLEEVEIEEKEENESKKSASKVKKYLKEQVKYLKEIIEGREIQLGIENFGDTLEKISETERLLKKNEEKNFTESKGNKGTQLELEDIKDLLKRIEEKEKELKQIRREYKKREEEIKQKIETKKKSFTGEEKSKLILKKLRDLITQEMHRYLNAEKKKIVGIFEKLWDKYMVSLEQLKGERKESIRKLDGFLTKLEYYNA
jgi:type I restriction enzyme M protein